ncbi:MAG: exodeoxyribonuclease III [Gammaproteobacteria bacterium]|jgi:exodeoxyribonuclease-3
MRVISANLNGIRSAHSKGFYIWLARQRADFVCLQETKAQPEQLSNAILNPKNWYTYFESAEKKGYSGVALFSRLQPDKVIRGLGDRELDLEGRYLQIDIGNLSVASVYFPSGSSGDLRQQTKFRFMDIFDQKLRDAYKQGRNYIFCGDWNIAHKEIDLRNWKGNKKNSGFLPKERTWLDRVFGELGYIDAFRTVEKREGQYTWWSNRGNAYANNVGWRIDYQVVSKALEDKITKATVYKMKRFSDHAPLIVDYESEVSNFS